MVTFVDGGALSISGSDAVTTPGGYQYAATGGNGPYTWSVSGTGASIDQTGYVTLNAACGTYEVTCTDCTGRSSSLRVIVTNNGKWTKILGGGSTYWYCNAGCSAPYGGSVSTPLCIIGSYRYHDLYQWVDPTCSLCTSNCVPPSCVWAGQPDNWICGCTSVEKWYWSC